jgi:hypothetical protein
MVAVNIKTAQRTSVFDFDTDSIVVEMFIQA